MKMLILGAWPEAYLAQVRESFPAVTFVATADPAEAAREVADADAIFGQPSREITGLPGQLATATIGG